MVNTKGVTLNEESLKPVAATKMVTRAKSTVRKVKLASKTSGSKVSVEKIKSAARNSSAAAKKGNKYPSKAERNPKRPVTTGTIAHPKKELIGVSVSGQKSEKRSKKKKVKYEVDCSDVTNMDIIDFQNYIRDNLKVANRKNNECLKVKVVQGTTVVVKSSVYMAKKSIRSLAYQYFQRKKIAKVHVRCETPNSYKLISDF